MAISITARVDHQGRVVALPPCAGIPRVEIPMFLARVPRLGDNDTRFAVPALLGALYGCQMGVAMGILGAEGDGRWLFVWLTTRPGERIPWHSVGAAVKRSD